MTDRPYVKMADVKLGDVLVADGGFDCLHANEECEVKQDMENCELYVSCGGPGCLSDRSERHFLSGQLDEHGYLIGFSIKLV